MVTTTRAQLNEFRTTFAGEIIGPDDAGYDDARRVWNATFDRDRPSWFVRPASTMSPRRFGSAVNGTSRSPSAAGVTARWPFDDRRRDRHRPRPYARCDRRPRDARRADGGGALLGELDIAAQEHGLVCPVGVVGHTGVAGLTLGGGIGRLQRHFGLTIDSLRAVELVTADGRLVRASAAEEPELFWGIRGAGANFGIVTSLEFGLHPFAGTLHRGVRIHPATAIHEVWSTFREFAASAPDAIAAIFTVGLGEPAADYPDSVAGRPIIVISYNHSGEAEDVERDIAPLLKGPRARQRHGNERAVRRCPEFERPLARLGLANLHPGWLRRGLFARSPRCVRRARRTGAGRRHDLGDGAGRRDRSRGRRCDGLHRPSPSV